MTEPQTQSLQSELEFEPITNDDLQEQITEAVSLLNESFGEATPQTSPTFSPLKTASGLEAKIDKLVDVMTQFIDLQIQGATQPSQIPLKKEKLKATTQPKSTTTVPVSQENHQTDDNNTQRASRNSPESLSAINGAINAIITHNNATDLHDLKWAISINAVKELVSDFTKSQRLIQKAISLRQDEIDQHHTHHQLETNHNHRHKRKRTIKEAIPFSSARPN